MTLTGAFNQLTPEQQRVIDRELFGAVSDGDVDEAKAALAHGANKNARLESNNYTPLLLATYEEQPAVVDLLLSEGADLNALDQEGKNALMIALNWHHEAIAIQLIVAGVSVRQADSNGDPAIFYALPAKDNRILEMMIGAGADINAQNQGGCTLLAWAVAERGRKVVPPIEMECLHRILQNKADINKPNVEGWTPLMRAVDYGDHEAVQFLLNCGADTECAGKDGKRAIDIAREKGDNKDIITMLEIRLKAQDEAKYAPFRDGTATPVKAAPKVAFRKKPAEQP